jgi:lipopolysaccharide export system permease protein
MLAGGISFRRILVPYLISAAIIAGATFYISSEIIPPGIRERLKFEYKYVEHKKFESSLDHQQLRISENEIIYVERYDITRNIGYKFSYDRFDGKKLEERITAMRIQHDSLYNWTAYNCMQRKFVGLKEEVTTHDEMKLELNMIPKDFVKVVKEYEQLTTSELVEYLETQSKRGLYGLNAYELELQKRIASPFSAFVLTIIGVSVASRKSRGGTGFHIFIGFLLSVTYILFNMVSSSLTIKGGLNPTISVWLPNVLYLAIGIYLYKIAPK